MTMAEDMSYNHGPMISQAIFEEFIAPYYRRIIAASRNSASCSSSIPMAT